MYYFKNFDKLLSSKTLNDPKNSFLIKFRYSLLNPVYYYLNKPTVEPNPFQLSLVSYHLLKVQHKDQQLLNQINQTLSTNNKDSALKCFKSKLECDLDVNRHALGRHLAEIRRILQIGTYDLPIENAVKAYYSLVFTSTNGENVIDAATENLVSIIKAKLRYSSYRNLVDLVIALNKAKNYDKSLWNVVLQKLEEKLSASKPQKVVYSGWTLDTYELDTKHSNRHFMTVNEKYYADFVKRGRLIANLKHAIANSYNLASVRFFYRFFFQENRISTTDDCADHAIEQEKFFNALNEAKQELQDNRIDTILEKAQKYQSGKNQEKKDKEA